MESLNKAEAQAMGHTTKADFTKMVESILKVSRRSSSLGLPRRPQQDRMDTDRRKSSSRAASQPRMLAPFYLRCPEVLRQWLKGHHEGIECHCTKGIPTITDFEFNTFMEAWRGGPAQILVLIIVSSQKPTLSAKLEEFTHNMYITAQRGRLAPCIKVHILPFTSLSRDSFLLTYVSYSLRLI
ncbi:hypothetical protein NDU88_008070 [Pleurodeles waltl]|uniref:Uncharacterized protein n=1 Tax=Pleurodeles waltl TaxID=8319 RepID=A0AAV7N5Y5_PLEWA|nr:hypothetical protein NDU88_008070 [Pleurodeles waltl]